MDRAQAEDIINNTLYGTDTDTGRDLLLDLIGEMGTKALTDEAVIRLAALHEQKHDGAVNRMSRGF